MELIVKVMCLNEIPKAEGLDIQRGLKYQEIVFQHPAICSRIGVTYFPKILCPTLFYKFNIGISYRLCSIIMGKKKLMIGKNFY